MRFVLFILLSMFGTVFLSCNGETKKADKLSDEKATNDVFQSEDLLGEYTIVTHEQYGGGLTTKEKADSYLGSKVVLSKKLFKCMYVEMENPTYKISRIDAHFPEGEIIPKDLSIHYGYKAERNYIDLLTVDPADDENPESPYIKLEIINANNLLDMFDGRFYMYSRD